jgi:hypothetical protein
MSKLLLVAWMLCFGSYSAAQTVVEEPSAAAQPNIEAAASVPLQRNTAIKDIPAPLSALRDVRIWLYTSVASQQSKMRLGIDPTTALRIWEGYLREARLPSARVSDHQHLDALPSDGLLILPSTIVLNDAEKRAVQAWRERGGSVLSTWRVGTHSADGQFVNHDFMRDTLDVQVVGDTEAQPADVFLILHGEELISHSIPAGTRMWLERVPKQLPLRMIGQRDAAQMTDWSRNYSAKLPSSAVTFSERQMKSGQYSRVVNLGFAEQNWQRSDPKVLKALADGVTAWLLHRPSAYLGRWPYPFRSASLISMQAGELPDQRDLAFARKLESINGRLTLYVVGIDAGSALALARQFQQGGHEIAYLGDEYEPFRGQSIVKQAQRMDSMRRYFSKASLPPADPSSLAIPADTYDQTTLAVAAARGFNNILGFTEVSEDQLPVFLKRSTNSGTLTTAASGMTATWMSLAALPEPAPRDVSGGMLILPRTLPGPEEAIAGDAASGFDTFLKSFNTAHRAGGLAVVRLPTQTSMTASQTQAFFETLSRVQTQTWITTASQLTAWWRQRAAIAFSESSDETGLIVNAVVPKGAVPSAPLSIWVTLPRRLARLRLDALEGSGELPRIAELEPDRTALVWRPPGPGKYRWKISFDPT